MMNFMYELTGPERVFYDIECLFTVSRAPERRNDEEVSADMYEDNT